MMPIDGLFGDEKGVRKDCFEPVKDVSDGLYDIWRSGVKGGSGVWGTVGGYWEELPGLGNGKYRMGSSAVDVDATADSIIITRN